METEKIVLDCDPRMDDSMTIVMAVRAPQLDAKAITAVNGSYPVDVTAGNALRMLKLLGRTGIPVARGMTKPMFRESPKDPFTHGKGRQAGNFLPGPVMPLCEKHAVDLIIDLIEEYPGEVYILSTGPMNNLVVAVEKAPEIKGVIVGIYTISGVFRQSPYAFANATGDIPRSKWNIYVDPEAVSIAYHPGVRLIALGLDMATHFNVNLTEEDLERLRRSDRREAKFLYQSTQFVKSRGFEAYCAVIDCMAVGYAIDETLMETFRGRVGIKTKDRLTLGSTVVDYRHHHVQETLPMIEVGKKAGYGAFLKILVELALRRLWKGEG